MNTRFAWRLSGNRRWRLVDGRYDRPAHRHKGYQPTMGLNKAGIEGVVKDFINTARRADAAGYDAIKLHAAHSYLLKPVALSSQ